jgi:selenocysteine lyase/cysteine desulfurase
MAERSEFGRNLRELFFLEPGFTNLNHGSFGTVPRVVNEAQNSFQHLAESHPDRWFRKLYYEKVEHSRSLVAELVRAHVQDVVLVENASSAVNSILRSLGLKRSDCVLRLSTAYGMVIETLKWMEETMGIQQIVVPVTFPVTDSREIANAVTRALDEHSKSGMSPIKICIFSHISSMPTMIEPIHELTAICKAAGALVLIDGAHAPGVLDIDIPSIGCDYYTGNCHKWLFAPKGVAFLWTAPERQAYECLQPTVVSSTGWRGYTERYSYTGTRDYTAFATLPAALHFCEDLGGFHAIYEYNHSLLAQGAALCVAAWGTSLLVPMELCAFMTNVVLPTSNDQETQELQRILDEEYNVYIVTGKVPVTNNTDGSQREVYFTRLSAQVYLELSDFQRLSGLVVEICGRI